MSKLFVVPTPIGNLNDMTLHFDISNKLQSYHKFNEHQQLERYTEMLQSGTNIALVSDAGTPAISDPGFLLVRACKQNDIEVETLPGATAFVPALVNSGLPNDRFVFEGFLPAKKGRQKRLNLLAEEEKTMIFYESPYRLVKTLEQFIALVGEDRQVSVSRELSKIHEENKSGTLKEVCEYFKSKTIKGEIVIILAGKNK